MTNFVSDTVLLSLADHAALSSVGGGTVEVRHGDRVSRLKRLDQGVEAALHKLADGPVGAGDLAKTAIAEHPGSDPTRLTAELERLAGRSLITFHCVAADEALLRATAGGPLARFDFTARATSTAVRISRFAYAHRIGDGMVVESPASYARVEIVAAALGSLLTEAACRRRIDELCSALDRLGAAGIRAAVGFLLGVGVLVPVDESGGTEDETSPALAQRELPDVALHAASRFGLSGSPIGGTYRFHGSIPPSPAIRPLPDGPRLLFPRPRLDRIMADDPPLGAVMEHRTSVRAHCDAPISVDQLGEFLFRVARVKRVRGIDHDADLLYESSVRTYPSGGAAYDLELYLTIRACAGVDPGMYHYDPAGHQLTRLRAPAEALRRLLLDAHVASGWQTQPQVLITLAARFARSSWKYEGIAYALTLKNVGVLYEAMYLAATAMGLAPCGLGCGDSAVFSAATGLDPLVESSVGEFMLGTPAEP